MVVCIIQRFPTERLVLRSILVFNLILTSLFRLSERELFIFQTLYMQFGSGNVKKYERRTKSSESYWRVRGHGIVRDCVRSPKKIRDLGRVRS